MHFKALASDYDGTLATAGIVEKPTLQALLQFKESGRKLILVTGREVPDLLRVFPEIKLFDCVVAENGALLYYPEKKEEKLLTTTPPKNFIEALQKKNISPLSVGRCIVATIIPHDVAVLEVIQKMNLDLHIILNKGAVMILPKGVNKRSGLSVALKELGLSHQGLIGVGDAENDLDFLEYCELSIAVNNALPGLKNEVDQVTQGSEGAGVTELILQTLKEDRS